MDTLVFMQFDFKKVWDPNKIDDFKIALAKKIRYRLTVIGGHEEG